MRALLKYASALSVGEYMKECTYHCKADPSLLPDLNSRNVTLLTHDCRILLMNSRDQLCSIQPSVLMRSVLM